MPDDTTYECFCGDTFTSREELIDHNVQRHEMTQGDSRRAVFDKYPE
ncbi:MAG TPA: hypothetical protein VM370_07915 [Candidatus Thermoplasmatota archaeon]|nr:hypothetical protein [Candidatus Thermoplasmatota archaeon]